MEMPHVEGSAFRALEARAVRSSGAAGTWVALWGILLLSVTLTAPSLSITLGARAILVHCTSPSCTNEAVIKALARLGVRIADPVRWGEAARSANEPRVDTANPQCVSAVLSSV